MLLADDNADMRDYLARLLGQRWRVVTVADGAAALAAARELQPDLVLADVMMPGLDGFELLRALRSAPDTQAIPVVLLSARAGDEARIEGMEAGADDYLVKPFAARELLARVGAHLQLTRMRQAAARQERAARLTAETTQRRLAILAEASSVLASSLDYPTVLTRLAQLLTPDLADWCTIDMLEPDQSTRQLVTVFGADATAARVRSYIARYPLEQAHPDHPVLLALSTGRSQIVSAFSADAAAPLIRDAAQLAALAELNISSYMCVPLVGRVGPIGVVSFVYADSRRHYTFADLALAEDLARRAALTIENTRLYAAEQQARQAAERATERITRLQAITAALSEALTPSQVSRMIVEQSVAAMGAYAGGFALIDAASATLQITDAIGYSAETIAAFTRFPVAVRSPSSDAVRDQTLVLVESPQAWATRYPHLTAVESAAVAVIPLIVEGRAIGALGLSFAAPRTFDADDQAFLLAIGRHGAQIFERARLYEAERTARAAAEAAQQRLAFLAEASRMLVDTLDAAETLQRLAQLTVPHFAELCVVYHVGDDGMIWRVASAHSDPASQAQLQSLQRHPIDPADPHPAAQAIHSRSTLINPTVAPATIDVLAPEEAQQQALYQLIPRSHIVVPMLARGQVLGAISFGLVTTECSYNADDLELAEELARRAALAVDNARLYRQAQEAVQVRDAFLSVAAHELKTPLTTLLGQAQLLQRRIEREAGSSERNRRTVQTIAKQANRLNRMISALLDISRLEVGQLQIERAPFDFVDLVRQVVEEVQPTLNRHILTCHAPDTPLVIHGDELRLHQVLHNLISNAIKYSPMGGAIEVAVRRTGDQAQVQVSDQGIGIPRASLPQLFQRFYRAPNADARSMSGMGIGLYVVREIITLHGGTIAVESAEGQGSVFTVTLPLTPPANPAP